MAVEGWRPMSGDAVPGLRWAMLADDVTGGCDAGVQFSLRGAATQVYLELPQQPVTAQVSVLVTHSRGDAAEVASRKVRQACDWIASLGAKLCYKKIDSTLQGNVGAELEAIGDKFPDRVVLVSPSLPNMERTLLDGWLRVRSCEAVAPIHLPSLLTGQGAQRLAHIPQPPAAAGAGDALMERIHRALGAGARIIVIDAVSEDHLRAIAKAAVQIVPQPLLVGSAGLAGPWSEALLNRREEGTNGMKEPGSLGPPASAVSPETSATGPVVFCIGSTNPVTRQQLQRLTATKRVETFNWQKDDPNQAQAALMRGCHLVVPLPPGPVQSANLRRLFSAILERSRVRGLLCSGGETARLVCTALEVQAIQLRTEILPGLPWGTLVGGAADLLPVCMKAGGFGNTDALCQAVNFLAAPGATPGGTR
jgi:uncharacterized protein YgbK (DUF1537 family)